jgi:hypothetical protein
MGRVLLMTEHRSIRTSLGTTLNKILPIPKVPKEYHAPPPPKLLSWVPHGRLGDAFYELKLEGFANEILALNSQRTNPIKYSARGWCYLLEGLKKIHKGEFSACQNAITDCRKAGLLSMDFVAEDQDVTRHFQGIFNASDPAESLRAIKKEVFEFLMNLHSYTTDYWKGEKYYLMMCVEKGDLLSLFRPICKKYYIPNVSSKGWSPLSVRAAAAKLSQKAEADGLTPVLLLFYDHDPVGLKISNCFRKNFEDCSRGTGWNSHNLIIDRFGLNKDDIDSYNLMWIENLKTGSGRESDDKEYIAKFGRRKCESNALFRDDNTLKVGEEICVRAIEKYYGNDAIERFKKKGEQSKEKLKPVYDNPIWKQFYSEIDKLTDIFEVGVATKEKGKETYEIEKEIEVLLDNKYYGKCPNCLESFNYSKEDEGRLKRCSNCLQLMRLKLKKSL